MNINVNSEAGKLNLGLVGRLDTSTAGMLEDVLKDKIESVNEIIMDFSSLDYISSAGLRVILGTQKQINAKKGKLIIKNVNQIVMEIFEITGFVDILTIEQ
ncbi:MAG: STAS domain-containing protein [Clostridiaceae bacterium]|nr:STAS domain-containing protein [Clostridiaceae bacterium]